MAVEPTIRVLSLLADICQNAPKEFGYLPASGSIGMADIEAEAKRFDAMSDWKRPLTDTHSIGHVGLFAASDFVRSYVALFDRDHPPVFAHLALSRPAMEACVVSIWLNDSAIAPVERLQRGLSERLYSAVELQRMDFTKEKGKETEDEIPEVAKCYGWEISGKEVGGVRRPRMGSALSEILVGDKTLGIGPTLWSYSSSVIHVSLYGIFQSVLVPPGHESPLSGPSLAAFGTDSKSVNAQSFCLLSLLLLAAGARNSLMGWDPTGWKSACKEAEQLKTSLLGSLGTGETRE